MSSFNWDHLFRLIETLVVSYFTFKIRRIAIEQGVATQASTEAAVKAAEVKEDLKAATEEQKAIIEDIKVEGRDRSEKIDKLTEKTDSQTKTLNDTHILVNDRFGKLSVALADALRWKANKTEQQVDIDNADKAQRDSDNHAAKQSIVDAQK